MIFTDLATAVREHGDLVREHFMTRVVPAGDSKFAALHGAFWDNGTFLYVPKASPSSCPSAPSSPPATRAAPAWPTP